MTYQKFAKIPNLSKDLRIRMKRGPGDVLVWKLSWRLGAFVFLISLPVFSFLAPWRSFGGASWFSSGLGSPFTLPSLLVCVHSIGLRTFLVNIIALVLESWPLYVCIWTCFRAQSYNHRWFAIIPSPRIHRQLHLIWVLIRVPELRSHAASYFALHCSSHSPVG